MDIDPGARDRLAARMEARALDLGLTWREVASRGGISYEIVRRLRTSSTSIRPLTLRKVDAGLDWEGGSAERVLNGGEPSPVVPEFVKRVVRGAAGLAAHDVDELRGA